MKLDDGDLEFAWYCAQIVIRMRQDNRQPIPAELRRRYDRLHLAIECMSATGQANEGEPSELDQDDWLTTPEVAAIVNRSARTAQRLAKRELGQQHGGRWLCKRSVVESYASCMT